MDTQWSIFIKAIFWPSLSVKCLLSGSSFKFEILSTPVVKIQRYDEFPAHKNNAWIMISLLHTEFSLLNSLLPIFRPSLWWRKISRRFKSCPTLHPHALLFHRFSSFFIVLNHQILLFLSNSKEEVNEVLIWVKRAWKSWRGRAHSITMFFECECN